MHMKYLLGQCLILSFQRKGQNILEFKQDSAAVLTKSDHSGD